MFLFHTAYYCQHGGVNLMGLKIDWLWS